MTIWKRQLDNLSSDERNTWLQERIRIAPNSCWIWLLAHNKWGYGTVTFRGVRTSAHRVAYWIFNGNIPDGMFVCHHCDNRPCVNPDHLYLGSNADNIKQAAERNRMTHKLQVAEIVAIRGLYTGANAPTQVELAEQFKVTQSQISRIVNYVQRKHVGLIYA